MSNTSRIPWSNGVTVDNHLLFSEVYLQQLRSQQRDVDTLRATLTTIRDTWRYYLPPPVDWAGAGWMPGEPLEQDDVDLLRTKIVEQILAYLGLTYGSCGADQRAVVVYTDSAAEDPDGLCLVLPLSSHIEGRDCQTGIIPKGHNYAQQLIRLLEQYKLDWGVLTNGRHWRLLHQTELSPTDTYLHVDLERIIAREDTEQYALFHHFFSRPAFAREEGRQRLDVYKEHSQEAAKAIEDHLSAQVEEIARQLCQGLVESCRASREDVAAAETRAAIYSNALFLIYRLLFVLYAEARDLLPLDEPTYRVVCLRDLLSEVLDNHMRGVQYDDDYAVWRRLQQLFALIDQGDQQAGVPAYNGGLFDPGRRPFLTEHSIRNDYLQAGLIRLGTIPAKGKSYDQDREPQPINYRDLSVRHLGSLYEGLLEYNLFVVEDEPYVVRQTKNKTKYVPYSQAGKVRASETLLQVGDVYFSETEGERKATGSYYTPEDVVDYIVRNTVGTKLADLKAEFYETRGIEHQLADLADTPLDVPAHEQIRESLDEQFMRFVREKVLHLKILDPAMGSGHFLVNATHSVANFIVELLNETHWENAGIDTNVGTWKREVAERCIFGVDINELAVELAKVCMWMTTTAKGKPLTFLDHHLRRGNSLVGAWLDEVGFYPLACRESHEAFTVPLGSFELSLHQVLAGYHELYAKNTDQVDEVREKARIFDQDIRPVLSAYRELLDLHASIYLGNRLSQATYGQMGTQVADPMAWRQLKAREGLETVLGQLADAHLFHWELEFPEAFEAGATDGVGFHVVAGNPPYAKYPEYLSPAFVEAHYAAAGSGDLYALFVERALRLARDAGSHLGFIVPLSLMFSNRLASLRRVMESNARAWEVHSFDKRPQSLFPSVQQRTSIILGHPWSGCMRISSGPLTRWKPEERRSLFSQLRAFDATDLMLELGIPKLGSDVQARALRHLLSTGGCLRDHIIDNLNNFTPEQLEARRVYFFGVAYRWLVAAKTLPAPVSPEGRRVHLAGFSALHFRRDEVAWAYMAILNSLLAFWFWLVYGDSFHVTKALLCSLPVDVDLLSDDARGEFARLGRELQREMLNHVFYSTMRGRVVANYNLLACRTITHQIDQLLVTELRLGDDFRSDIEAFCASAVGQRRD
jgi:hypothetical protein